VPELTPTEQLLKAFMGVVASDKTPEQMSNFLKDIMPNPSNRPVDGYLFDGGPFSQIEGDIYSLAISQSSELTKWLPTELVNYTNDIVQHLSWAGAPYAMNGSQTYSAYLSTIVIGDCGYGPSGTNWDGFSYEVGSGSFSFTTPMMTVWKDSGLKKYHQEFPMSYNIIGGNGATQGRISNDKDWALAQLLDWARSHVDFINIYGERQNSDMEWDGLSTIIQTGYIPARLRGSSGNGSYANPLVVSGAALGTPADPGVVLKTLDEMVKDRLLFAAQRGWTVNNEDIALLMHPFHLEMLQEALAAGGLLYYTSTYGFTGQMTVGEYETRLRAMQDNKTLPLGNRDIKVITEINLGSPSTVDVVGGGTNLPAHTSDIFFLCKKVNGIEVLANKFVNWRELDYPDAIKNDETMTTIQGGLARTGYVTESNKCYYYYLEVGGRMVVKMMPMQARLTNVTIQKRFATTMRDQNQWWAPYYAAFNGVEGFQGSQLLFGQRTA
jgi:hypothetical protein